MTWLIQLLIEAIREQCSQFIVDAMEVITELFTDLLSCDLTLFEELFSVVGSLYRNAILPLSVALLLMIFTWQLFKSMFGVAGMEGEDPIQLTCRSAACLFMIFGAKSVINYVLNIAGTPYSWVVGTDIEVVNFSEYVSALSIITATLGIDSVSVSLLMLIMQFVVAWNYFKMLQIIAERYVLLGVMSYTAPLAFATGGSKATNNILNSWCKMFGGQVILVILNAWCMKLFLAGYGNMLASGYGFTKFFAATLCLVGFCKITFKLDSYMASLGVSMGRTAGGMGGMALMMAAGRMLSRFGGGSFNFQGGFFGGGGTWSWPTGGGIAPTGGGGDGGTGGSEAFSPIPLAADGGTGEETGADGKPGVFSDGEMNAGEGSGNSSYHTEKGIFEELGETDGNPASNPVSSTGNVFGNPSDETGDLDADGDEEDPLDASAVNAGTGGAWIPSDGEDTGMHPVFGDEAGDGFSAEQEANLTGGLHAGFTNIQEAEKAGHPETGFTDIPEEGIADGSETTLIGVPQTGIAGKPGTGFSDMQKDGFAEKSESGFADMLETGIGNMQESVLTGEPVTGFQGEPADGQTGESGFEAVNDSYLSAGTSGQGIHPEALDTRASVEMRNGSQMAEPMGAETEAASFGESLQQDSIRRGIVSEMGTALEVNPAGQETMSGEPNEGKDVGTYNRNEAGIYGEVQSGTDSDMGVTGIGRLSENAAGQSRYKESGGLKTENFGGLEKSLLDEMGHSVGAGNAGETVSDMQPETATGTDGSIRIGAGSVAERISDFGNAFEMEDSAGSATAKMSGATARPQNMDQDAFNSPKQSAGRMEHSYPDADQRSLPSYEMADARPGTEHIPSGLEAVHSGSILSSEQGTIPEVQELAAKQQDMGADWLGKSPNGDEAISDTHGFLMGGHEMKLDRAAHEGMTQDAAQHKEGNTESEDNFSNVYAGGILQEIALNKADWRDEKNAAPGREVD